MADRLVLHPDPPEEPDDTYPALQFERYFGLSDIGTEWVMPGGRTMYEMEQELKSAGILSHDVDGGVILTEALAESRPDIMMRFAYAQALAQELRQLNPALNGIDFDPPVWHDLRHFLHGVVSGFNPDDIEDWLKGRRDQDALETLQNRIYEEHFNPSPDNWYPQELKEKFNGFAYGLGAPVISFINWVPSRPTIEKINSQLDAKENGLRRTNQVSGAPTVSPSQN